MKSHHRDQLIFERLEDRRVLDGQLLATLGMDAASILAEGESPVELAQTLPERFSGEEELRDFLTRQAIERYGGMFGQEAWPSPWLLRNTLTTGVEATADMGPALDHSETNNQVAGVEEGDIAETDGQFIYLAGDGNITVIDARTDHLSVSSRFPIDGSIAAMYLEDGRLTVLTHSWQSHAIVPMLTDAILPYEPVPSELLVTVLDVSNPSELQTIRQFQVEGDYVDSRMIQGTLYLVSQDRFQLPAPEVHCDNSSAFTNELLPSVDVRLPWHPWQEGTCVYETQQQYFERVEGQVLELSIANYTEFSGTGAVVETGWLTSPELIYKPVAEEQNQLLSISAWDVANDVPFLLNSAAMPVSWSGEIYVSPEHAYIVEPSFHSSADGPTNAIYQLDLGITDGEIDLVAQGRTQGSILSQFSMDEYGGYLRVVTQRGTWREPVSSLTVFQKQGEQLQIVGQVDDIAPAERLYSVRFMEDRAYVVTFGPDGGRWTDPLFTIDLSDPAAPQIEGELEIPGFSNYLHLVGDHYLLGLGRNADSQTGRALEPQVSLFDVADFSTPVQLDNDSFALGGWSWSEAFGDHHAVSFFPEYGVLAVPMSSWGPEIGSPGRTQHALWVFQIDTSADITGEDRIQTLGVVEHDSPVRRSLRIGDRLFSISRDDIQVQRLSSPETAIDRLYWASPARDDRFRVRQDAGETLLDVLANDVVDDSQGASHRIVDVTQPEAGGQVRISDDGLSLIFAPSPDFEGSATFRYTVDSGDLGLAGADVYVDVYHVPVKQRMTELAVDDLAQRLDIPPNAIATNRVERVVWPDSCLGVPSGPDTICAQVLTPGFQITLSHDGDRFVYHTDTVDQVVLASSERLPDLVQIRAEAVDVAGQPISTIQAGESFTLNLYVQDLRDEPHGVYSAYTDILYYGRRVQVDGEISYGPNYPNGHSGDGGLIGLVDEVGAFSGLTELDGTEQLLARIPMTARRPGSATIRLNPADLRTSEVAVYGSDEVIPPTQVVYIGTQLEITEGWRNEDSPEDVNGDGETTPSDALTLINDLNRDGSRRLVRVREFLQQAGASAHRFLDVNGDGVVSASDALWVINKLNQRASQASGGDALNIPETLDLPAPLDSFAAWVDWAALESNLQDQQWTEALETLEVAPENAIDLIHQTVAPVNPRDFRPGNFVATGQTNLWRSLSDLRTGAGVDASAADRLFEAAGKMDRFVAEMELERVFPELGRHFDLEAARQAFHEKLARGLTSGMTQTT